ncbi:5-(carboxyamino)imidazole ribonucleotide mutase [Actinophytocola xanthii]|uniref:N5-carboxyaminoimidazole ribonucleotide mutase n=2 Tax=Actinophytocola xanthii TaxID=1912961 RepID=A0A1Q8CW49_9PSEU|nr:5-(carboxyamino)imidazole ribonucleotide mutase [Actinophytocola xanthii]
MASRVYADRMDKAAAVLTELGVPVTTHVLSAHRTPDETAEFARTAADRGYAVLICGAGQAAHVAGMVAAYTTLPVIGVPLGGGPLGGVDSLYSTVQMPNGYPVATVAVDGGVNAGLLAAQIIATAHPEVGERVASWRARRVADSVRRTEQESR